MNTPKRYVGIHNEINGGMTDTAKIIRDAWVFGLIPETETCEGWLPAGIQSLWEKVDAEWEKYGFRVGALPDDIRANFMRIQNAAIARAREEGWDGEQELAGD
ncbi:hypothetical protein VK792_09640 [Mesobacterium sp. TK19101]|uniref:Uncharacterized protein n=1 Tax=Mesobacterium hydrothermale TaxID=3111907 RepID=A0ABU6HK65_9RHOB|nr:hypothetical protein [Mesobacterium sp. TK19101]MEC3861545.1 hypothetical protein [Mesobacterium sp. TK19101]